MSEPTGSACARTGPTTEKIIRIFAGAVILVSLALGASGSPLFISAKWLWLTAFVGANLLQSAFTGLCPLDTMLRKVFHVRTEAEAARMGR
ncbi:MAG: DUF2892 domain-containing protein [Burkholderiaceae bacterium]